MALDEQRCEFGMRERGRGLKNVYVIVERTIFMKR